MKSRRPSTSMLSAASTRSFTRESFFTMLPAGRRREREAGRASYGNCENRRSPNAVGPVRGKLLAGWPAQLGELRGSKLLHRRPVLRQQAFRRRGCSPRGLRGGSIAESFEAKAEE